jgi:hypothetical protein
MKKGKKNFSDKIYSVKRKIKKKIEIKINCEFGK